MATYLELHLKGGGVAMIDTGAIAGAIAKGARSDARGVPEAPTLVLLRAGETLEVINESPMTLIARIVQLRRAYADARATDPRVDVLVDWLTPMEAPDEPAGA